MEDNTKYKRGGSAGAFVKGFTNAEEYQRELPIPRPRLAITTDDISPTHTIEFCTPVPTDSFDKSFGLTPQVTDCGVFTKYLEDFPSNDLPSGGPDTVIRISPSEMQYVFLRLDNYPREGGTIRHKWIRSRDNKILFDASFTVSSPDPSWTFWFWWAWSLIGHFDHEIIEPGDYYLLLITPWGNARIDFIVKASPKIFNACWGSILPSQCTIPPSQPVVTQNTTVNIKADIVNDSPSNRRIQAIFKDGTTTISTPQEIQSLAPFPGGGYWSPTVSFTMPNRTVPLTIETYGWDGRAWDKSDVVSSIISTTTPTCTGISIDASTVIGNVGDTINLIAFGITPTTQSYSVRFTDRNNNILGTCTSLNGLCTIQWNTTGLSPGQYFVKAEVPSQCVSTELAIGLSLPTRQWNVDIFVKDRNTNNVIPSANITVSNISGAPSSQTLQTDTNGFVSFRVNEGTISVTILKQNYVTFNDVVFVFNNLTGANSKNYLLTPSGAPTGSLRFITSPPGISNVEIHFIGDVPTLKGTTDINGILAIDNLTDGRIVNYEVRKSGFNTATGTKTVIGGIVTDAIVTMTSVTPSTGNVCMKSNPAGASITIDNILQSGKSTALSFGGCLTENIITNLTPISHNFILNKIGFEPKSGTITPIVSTTIDFDAGNLIPIATLGILRISSIPEGARIYLKINNVFQDTSFITGTPSNPTVITTLTAGTYDYRLTLSGFQDKLGTFAIVTNQTTIVSESLTPITITTGNVDMLSFPSGAVIFIDNVNTNKITPSTVSGLSPGIHTYRLTFPGFEDKTGEFNITTDQTSTVNVAMTAITPGAGDGGLTLIALMGLGILGAVLLAGGPKTPIIAPTPTLPPLPPERLPAEERIL